uniref:Uncharacterized protein n=1 Tax=Cacopsylla melanoneura TaxID=428564 RepID=A0A8D9ES64_9HEMI
MILMKMKTILKKMIAVTKLLPWVQASPNQTAWCRESSPWPINKSIEDNNEVHDIEDNNDSNDRLYINAPQTPNSSLNTLLNIFFFLSFFPPPLPFPPSPFFLFFTFR